MNFILNQHTPTEMVALRDEFERFKESNSIDLPIFNFNNNLKGTGIQVNFCFYTKKRTC